MVERPLKLKDEFLKQKDLLVGYWWCYEACYDVQ